MFRATRKAILNGDSVVYLMSRYATGFGGAWAKQSGACSQHANRRPVDSAPRKSFGNRHI